MYMVDGAFGSKLKGYRRNLGLLINPVVTVGGRVCAGPGGL